MKINFITLFPKYYDPFQSESIVKRAIDKKLVEVNVVDFREFSVGKHNKVDDIVYGGGQGMLLMVEPIDKALETTKGRRILLSPQGNKFTQEKALELSKLDEVTFVAGHYEGFDERVRSLVDEELSIGDYVLTGGELPSMVMADSIIRLIPGVIREASHVNDSFQGNLLDHPQYTRPRVYKGMEVPEVLLNGNHAKIEQWRKEKQMEKTLRVRPDLLKGDHNEK
ncbi:tRNA (guanosine(37)-N1)-methyltransferase TrmD [Mycoplasma todarodis]|uniref:tRNA (guanine-N(1)-)-methyltransferase n=1 Tax=Mycoplasma todarodis TaxID=1937191 RepID=A0A4R0XKH7_9MOLU|nr:tRNA (guanosine(37)-N1)-methyltransferase TrmD [Mycoplasma todarodis]TCG10964.1 tRNA (guanosine(37)-N1)-methyltransferase TrmD [Mycoplasma todarodis]